MIFGSNNRGQILASWLPVLLFFSLLLIIFRLFYFVSVQSQAEDQEFREFRKSLIERPALVQ